MPNESYHGKSMFWRGKSSLTRSMKRSYNYDVAEGFNDSFLTKPNQAGVNPLVKTDENQLLRDYEVRIKSGFDEIKTVVQLLFAQQSRADFSCWAQTLVLEKLGIKLGMNAIQMLDQSELDSNAFYAECVFEQFTKMSKEFFETDPLAGRNKIEAERVFREAGFHAVGIAPCSDGRLAHFSSYALRLPYTSLHRIKAHAGALFNVSESVRNWVFIEHSRFRDGVPNSANESTSYLKIAVYHYSKSDPTHQGCAAHGSDEATAAKAALLRLKEFRQAIENRFGCRSTVQILLIGMNTDDDSLKVHVPNLKGKVCLKRFVETDVLFQQTTDMDAKKAREAIKQAVDLSSSSIGSTASIEPMNNLIAWLIENNFSQIGYVKRYENGCYTDIGHAERFIGIGSGFEEVQLRNLTYYSFLNTVEEGLYDVNIGVKIFTGLNLKKNLPIPIVICCDYDGRVPGSKDRAEEKAKRIKQALHDRYTDLSESGQLFSFCTLRDYTGNQVAERMDSLA